LKQRGVRIDQISLRMGGGVSPQQARQRAGSMAHQIARAVAQARVFAGGRTAIERLSVRVREGASDAEIAAQIAEQLRAQGRE